MVYTLEEIARRIRPVAEKYRLKAVYIFGSYARGDATEDSDIDLLVDDTGANIHGWEYGGLYSDLEQALEKELDMVTVDALDRRSDRMSDKLFQEYVSKERRQLYAIA